MARFLSNITLVVDDYDLAIEYFTNILGFVLVEDTKFSDGKRWVVINPCQDADLNLACNILLAQASSAEQRARIGDQTGGRVGFFLHTDNFDEDFDKYRAAGVNFLQEPRVEAYGKVVVFKDICGNQWDLIQLNR